MLAFQSSNNRGLYIVMSDSLLLSWYILLWDFRLSLTGFNLAVSHGCHGNPNLHLVMKCVTALSAALAIPTALVQLVPCDQTVQLRITLFVRNIAGDSFLHPG